MNDEFELKAEQNPEEKKAAADSCCPFARIPPQFWERIFRKPFYKRHPFIFWGSLLLLIALMSQGLYKLFDKEDEPDSENCLALVNIQGPIINAEPVLAWIRRLENKAGVKGILLRVDSPGGGAAASQEIYAALMRIGRKMPIVVSMGAMAASGGLMISMAGERIYANPSTITGSIGVRMDIPQVQGLLEKIGVGQETLVTAPFKDAASYMHPLSPQAREYLESVLMNMHAQFVDIVAKGRKMDIEKARTLASGKIFTGEQALGMGLVDVMGGQYEAHQWLAEKTGVPLTQALLRRPSSPKGWLEYFANTAASLGLNVDSVLPSLHGAGLSQPVFLYQF